MIKKKKSFRNFTLDYFLTNNYGVGLWTCYTLSVLVGLNQRFGIRRRLRIKQVLFMKRKTCNMYIGIDVIKDLRERIIDLIKLKTYRGTRHKMKLPSHGQRTHTNGKTKQKFRY